MVSYAPLYQDITNSFVSAVMPLKKNMGSLGMTLTYVTFGEMEKMDSAGNYLGEMVPYNMAVAVPLIGYWFEPHHFDVLHLISEKIYCHLPKK